MNWSEGSTGLTALMSRSTFLSEGEDILFPAECLIPLLGMPILYRRPGGIVNDRIRPGAARSGPFSETRVTVTHDAFRFDMITKTTSLLDSGLLGPVSILREAGKTYSSRIAY
jgi:hypothetical protein